MKKLTFKAFTLVEMLIVIVIIGILIAALLPRLQGAQGMARDTARQTALSQLQAAIVTYQSLNGNRPHGSGTTGDPASNAINTNELVKLVTSNIMSGLPTDPNLGNEWTGMNNNYVGTGGGFQYLVLAKNTVKKAGFILMAKTEIPGKSNWVMQQENCDSGAGKPTQDD
ncbi:MAG: prepilin-type N-terminal cleavage/methylation domain-containing protein [Candidatus Peribacteria bacterium]|jgi:prepilin-type N-terminal cleavage/methylation domain-containing protein|nr:prepilin-type N-terminal cleavage/methylation domain-containing protein [Candidatus Peribacteria bacterium]